MLHTHLVTQKKQWKTIEKFSFVFYIDCKKSLSPRVSEYQPVLLFVGNQPISVICRNNNMK